ncbi:MAG: class I SAM-dependent methyltransferase [Verrucomicrobiota bacterium]
MSDGPLRCHLCGSTRLELSADYPHFKRVTSDCKPWPAGGTLAHCLDCHLVQTGVTPAWEAEAREIYRQYTIYHQSGGVEQSVFAQGDGKASLRSDRLVQALREHCLLPTAGRALDLGCGNGAFLRACCRSLSGWELFGAEVDEKYQAQVEAISGFKRLFTGNWQDIPGTFHLISLIHVLEHIAAPLVVLEMLLGKLEPRGLLLVQVPDCAQNPFSTLVADHCSHFSVGALREIISAAGFEVLQANGSWVSKEVSVVARKPEGAPARRGPKLPADEAAQILAGQQWLADMLRRVEPLAKAGRFGIFGTSIAATWLQAQLEGGAEFFVDEDPGRAGKQHLGKPILPPLLIPGGSTVFVALPQPLAGQIAARIRRPGIRVETP